MARLSILAALIWCGLGAMAGAEPYPQHQGLFVNDYADVLDAADETSLRDTLADLAKETGIEMTVLTIRSRSDYDPSASIEAFATELFNAWGIGDAERNDGILLLLASDDRELRLELGSAYDQGYDVLAEHIVSRFFVPDLRDGDAARAIRTGTEETIARIARRRAERLPAEALPDAGGGLPGWLPFAVIATIGGLLIARRRIADASYALRRCPSCGRVGMRRVREIAAPASADAQGRGIIHTTCRHCNFREDRDYPITRRQKTGKGGSFGGGRSSGGGATGRW